MPVDTLLPKIHAQIETEIIEIDPIPALDIPMIMEAKITNVH
jgi:hypothetical protein